MKTYTICSTIGDAISSYSNTMCPNTDLVSSEDYLVDLPSIYGQLFSNAYEADSDLAVLNLFNLRDHRTGKGCKALFTEGLQLLTDYNPDLVVELLPVIVYHGNWSDPLNILMVDGIDKFLQDQVITYYADSIKDELKPEKPKSTLGRWLPATSSPNATAIACSLYTNLDKQASLAMYNRTRSNLKHNPNKISKGMWDTIHYNNFSSKSNPDKKQALLSKIKHKPKLNHLLDPAYLSVINILTHD